MPISAARRVDAQAEQQRHEHHRGGDDEEAEAEEQRLNGVVPAEAASPCCFTGWKTKPIAAGSSAMVSVVPSSRDSAGQPHAERRGLPEAARPQLSGPWPARRTPWAWRRGRPNTSSSGRIRRASKGNRRVPIGHRALVGHARHVGRQSRSAAAPASSTMAAKRKAFVVSRTCPSCFRARST